MAVVPSNAGCSGPGNSSLLWWESCLFSEAKFRVNKMQGFTQHGLDGSTSSFQFVFKNLSENKTIIVASPHCPLERGGTRLRDVLTTEL